MSNNYYLITGLNAGFEITPYIVYCKQYEVYDFISVYGDACRYFEEISKEKAEELQRNGIELY